LQIGLDKIDSKDNISLIDFDEKATQVEIWDPNNCAEGDIKPDMSRAGPRCIKLAQSVSDMLVRLGRNCANGTRPLRGKVHREFASI